jgi:ribosomal protein L11 methyltransferase
MVEFSQASEIVRESVRTALREAGFAQFVESCPDYKEHNPDYAENGNHIAQDLSRLSVYSFDKSELVRAESVVAATAKLSCEIAAHSTKSWQDGWKESFQPFSVGRFYVHAPWHEAEVELSQDGTLQPVCIDPGMAFGTGQHATTYVCLQLLSELGPKALTKPLLDCGSGSGILSISAAKLGAKDITATDIEADAILAIQENCQRNHITCVKAVKESVPAGEYGLIMANILTPVLERLLPEFQEALASGGTILFSGILAEQKQEFIAKTTELGWSLRSEYEKDGWVGLMLEKA